ncbi:MAG: hypothetical protein A3A33_02855 [Candidatus Yanofskybacteria bacterium RIFCSPLOWO2_01_FULL_49_25]|uniref:Uncharacterized protein n=1 Tax=Candidatus Yanofskybacteria bacterium RIFCSPLOWO2_01_FULL_49_25 TaxID=1802701 RepID=A0A1F8GUS8_9BACT|nr:MAG: hypothetical protein A3A33_02855 [Candidatus Yanofskybacteria bacterium RIFCSPLOWO2_01_FULL_49_25]
MIPFTLLLIWGLYIVSKKEVKISSKRSIKGRVAQIIGILIIFLAILAIARNLVPEGPTSDILVSILSITIVVVIITCIYFIFLHKSNTDNSQTTQSNL